MLNRRYEDAIQYYRKAIALDPQLWTARSELGINLMRLGQTDEAMEQLADCFHHGLVNSATKNTLKLLDKYVNFVTTKSGLISLRLDKKEAGILHPYFEAEIERVIATYEAKYKMKLDRPVLVEAFPNHEDFAVRTLGMPGLGALGVTFTSRTYGSTIALDSPSGRKPGEFHWDSTLWHEMSHVFTLTMTNSLVPRWFTEGIAVHEETAANPEWGDRITPEILMAIKNHQLLPVADLDRGAASLEGYLFPDTYHFPRKFSAVQICAAMVRRFRGVAGQIGLKRNLHRVVTLASLVERETAVDAERPMVASVFENRLAKKMPLMTDPAVIYGLELEGRWRGTIYHSDLSRDTPYNTYLHAGLPPGPVANPGVKSLRAAMQPAQTDYLYFVAAGANPQGHSMFSRTLDEQNRNVAGYRHAVKKAGGR